jgi:hypothetical protein
MATFTINVADGLPLDAAPNPQCCTDPHVLCPDCAALVLNSRKQLTLNTSGECVENADQSKVLPLPDVLGNFAGGGKVTTVEGGSVDPLMELETQPDYSGMGNMLPLPDVLTECVNARRRELAELHRQPTRDAGETYGGTDQSACLPLPNDPSY